MLGRVGGGVFAGQDSTVQMKRVADCSGKNGVRFLMVSRFMSLYECLEPGTRAAPEQHWVPLWVWTKLSRDPCLKIPC